MANSPNFTPRTTKERWERQRTVIAKLYDHWQAGNDVKTSVGDVATLLDVPRGDVEGASTEAVAAGILVREQRRNGRYITSHWMLIPETKAEALGQLDAHFTKVEEARLASWKDGTARGVHRSGSVLKPTKREVEKAAIQKRAAELAAQPAVKPALEERVAQGNGAAITGPDAPKPFAALAPMRKNEAAALVEAARQYADRGSTVDAKLDEIERTMATIGVAFDREMLRGSITLERDERLETVGLVLPYIHELEQRVARLTQDNTDLRGSRDELRQLKETSAKQRQQIDRLIAERDTLRRGHLS